MKKISFQGISGAYSDLVCRKFYKSYKTLPCNSFETALSSVKKGFADLAMIPIENSIAGRVNDMHILLEYTDLKIVAEYFNKIEHHLLIKESSSNYNVKNVYSHTQALSQCKKNIKKLKLFPINFIDTAAAAEFVSKSAEHDAAIASDLAAKTYGLKIIKKNLEDEVNNITRFLVFARKSINIDINQRARIIFGRAKLSIWNVHSPSNMACRKFIFFVNTKTVTKDIQDSHICLALRLHHFCRRKKGV